MTVTFCILLTLSIFSQLCSCYHILISAITSSYGHWTELNHLAKEILSRRDHNGNPSHFITFFIDENYDKYLNTIRNEPNINNTSYQIIYTPIEPRIDMEAIREVNTIQLIPTLIEAVYSHSMASFESKAIYLNHSQTKSQSVNCNINNFSDTQFEYEMNNNLMYKHNKKDLIITKKVDLCLVDIFQLFDIILCNEIFEIPTINIITPVFSSKVEYYNFRNTYIYYYDPFTVNFYSDLKNGTIMSYKQKWINFIANSMFNIIQKYTSHYMLIPMIKQLNINLKQLNINKIININKYKNGFFSFWDQTAMISSLGPPFTPIFYHRSRIKQYGFLLYKESNYTISIDLKLLEWINNNTTPILLISMGSSHLLSENVIQNLYFKLIKHNEKNNYRILWALRQNIHKNKSNDQFETDTFKIRRWIQQFELLQHDNIKLFLTHAGINGIIESIYSKKIMLLNPMKGDQFINAKRTEELECGLIIEDRENFSGLEEYINILLLNKTSSKYYQHRINYIHDLLLMNGGIHEAVDFIEYCSKFGVKHLLCTIGNDYDCTKTIIPWYQQTMIDIYIIISGLLMFIMMICCKMCFKYCF
eukprot:62942_1